MHDFTIALVAQHSPVLKKNENLRNTIAWTRKAMKKGADLVVFPELNITGHAGDPAMVARAEPVPGGPSIQALIELAGKLNVFISAGIAEEHLGIHYNTQFIVGPEGYVGKQRKTHLSVDEYFYFRHGTALPVCELPFARVGIIICYDNAFPECARCMALDGAEVLLCVHASRFFGDKWPRTRTRRARRARQVTSEWARLHYARARDNGVYVALCNAAGRSATGIRGVEANHAGGCMVVDPTGNVVAETRQADIKEDMLVVPLKADEVHRRRMQRCFNLQTRRPEVFRALTRPTQ